MTTEQHQQFLQYCIDLALESVASGGGPFGAVIVRNGEVVAQSDNRVTAHSDPTAHAEIEAIRHAAQLNTDPHLDDCVLYASCEPCPMCLAAAMWARIPRIVYAAPHSEAMRAGFADTAIATQLYGQPTPVALLPDYLQQYPMVAATAPFDAWLANELRIEY